MDRGRRRGAPTRGVSRRPSRKDYAELLRFRTSLRRFLRWSEDHRLVHLLATQLGEERIEELSRLHLEELRSLPRWPGGAPTL